MAQQFEVEATGLNGIEYRIEIYNSGYGGATVTDLLGNEQFIRFEGGQRERVGIEPIWGQEARINVRTNEDLSPLFGLQDRDAEVRVYRTDTSSLVWKGFILTDFFQDEPLTYLPGVELRAVDGLTTLEGDRLNALSGVSNSDIGDDSSFISYTDLFTGVLSTLYDSPLDVEFAVEWYPDAGGQLTSSDNPLRYSGARPDVYYDSENGEWFDQQSALEDALKSQGLEIRQAVIGGELTWLVAQPSALSTSSVKTWRYAPGGTEDASSPFSRDFSLDLSTADTNAPTREFERRSGSVSVTHNHGGLDNVISEPSFEDQGASWSFTSGLDVEGSVTQYDFAPPAPGNTQDNTYLLELTDNGTNRAFPVAQNFGDIAGLPPGTVGRLQQTFYRNGARYEKLTRQQSAYEFRLNIGSQYLTDFLTDVRQGVDPGKGSLPVKALDRPIPEGARLPIQPKEANVSGGESLEAVSYITLSERADSGDTTLVGDISKQVAGNLQVRYAGFVGSQDSVEIWKWKNDTQAWSTFELIFSLVDTNGDRVTGDTTIEIGGERPDPGGPAASTLEAYADDIQLSFEVAGSVLSETTRQASVSANGADRNIAVRLSSGPTSENPRRVKGVGPSSNYQATDWGIGAGGGSLSLAGLQTRERLRYLRQHLERQQLTVYPLNKSPVVTGEEIIQFDGKTWRIADFSSDPHNGEIGLTLIQHADEGTSNITIETVRDTEDGGATGGGGTVPAVGGGGGGAAGVEVIQLDAGNGSVTETLPPPSSGATAVALRVDTSPGNTATLETQNTGSEEIRFAEGKNKSSTTLDVEQSLLLSSDGSDWYVEEGQGLRAEAETITTDGATKNSPLLKQTATYDSDPTSSVTSSDVSIERYVRTDNSGNAVLVYESGGTEIARLSSGGRFETRKDQEAFMSGSLSSGSGTNSLLFFEDANNSRSTTDLAKLTVKGSGVTITNPNTDEYVLDISGGGSSVGSLSDLSDVNSANRSDGNVLATGSSTLWREESITTLTQQHVDLNNLSDVGTAGVTNGNILIAGGVEYDSVGLDTAAGNHLDLADLKNTAYSSLTGTPSIAYNSTIPADNFTSTEVTNLRSGELDDGSTPWTSNNFFDAADARTAVEGTSDVTDLVSNATASVGYVPASDGTGGVSWDDPETHVHTRPIAGDGLDDSSGTFLIDVSDFAGHGLEDNNDNLRIDAANIGDGLDGGSGSDLSVDVSDFDGDGLTSSTNDLDVDSTVARTNIEETFKGADFYTTTFTTTNTSNGAANLQLTRSDDDSGWEISGPRTGESDKFKLYRKTPTASFNEVITATTSGNVGIGIGATSPSYTLEVSGDARSTGEVEAFLGSDRRLKTGLDPLDSALDKVDQLTGYGFDWREKDAVQPHKRGKTDVGLIAQEVEGVLPEAVREFQDGHSEGYKSVSYDKLVPLLIEAIKDLRSQVDQFQ
jgi:hypothetical protein